MGQYVLVLGLPGVVNEGFKINTGSYWVEVTFTSFAIYSNHSLPHYAASLFLECGAREHSAKLIQIGTCVRKGACTMHRPHLPYTLHPFSSTYSLLAPLVP